MENVTGYQTTDGQFFHDKEQAAEHQKKLDIYTLVKEHAVKLDLSIDDEALQAFSYHSHFEDFFIKLTAIFGLCNYTQKGMPSLAEMRYTMNWGQPHEKKELIRKLDEIGMVWDKNKQIPLSGI